MTRYHDRHGLHVADVLIRLIEDEVLHNLERDLDVEEMGLQFMLET